MSLRPPVREHRWPYPGHSTGFGHTDIRMERQFLVFAGLGGDTHKCMLTGVCEPVSTVESCCERDLNVSVRRVLAWL